LQLRVFKVHLVKPDPKVDQVLLAFKALKGRLGLKEFRDRLERRELEEVQATRDKPALKDSLVRLGRQVLQGCKVLLALLGSKVSRVSFK
jgi:hypothetical protein